MILWLGLFAILVAFWAAFFRELSIRDELDRWKESDEWHRNL